MIEKITESGFPIGYYYAHIPSLGLTTQGEGIDGAIVAAKDLLDLWIEEKKANNERIVPPAETYYFEA